jgi:hypothetical protein
MKNKILEIKKQINPTSPQVLAKKVTVLYKLAQEQLSRQNHYDFGLRTLKAVLVMAGELRRGSPDLPENVVLMRALRYVLSLNGKQVFYKRTC